MSIVIAIVNKFGEKGFVDTFVDGADDMIGVILIMLLLEVLVFLETNISR